MHADHKFTPALANLKRLGFLALIFLLVFGMVLAAAIYFLQDSMIYYPRRYGDADLEAVRDRVQTVEFKTSAGRQTAFYVPPSAGSQAPAPARLWLVFGGNGSVALDWLQLIDSLQLTSDGFLLVDYPGYGLCEGRPSPATIEESVDAAMAAWRRLSGEGEAGERIPASVAVLGHSLGCAAALTAAEKFGAHRIVLLSPFTSMKEMASRVVGRPLANLLRHRYDNREPAQRLMQLEETELTIIHGVDDEIIPHEMGRELADINPQRIGFHSISGAGHNDITLRAFPVIREAMR